MSLGYRFAGVVVLVGLVSAGGAWADEITVTWTGAGGDGLYSTAANWDNGVVPVNSGGTTYAVVIPDSVSVTYDVDSPQQVTDFNLGTDSTFTVNPGKSLTVLDDASVGGVVTANNSTFSAESASALFSGNAARLDVQGGGTIAIDATSYSSTGLSDTYDLFRSQGSGSLLDLSELQSINAFVSSIYARTHTISATSSGTVDLSGLQTVQGRAGDDWLVFKADSSGVLDLSSLQTLTGGNTRFDLDVPTFSLSKLQSTVGAHFDVSATTTLNMGKLTSFDSGWFTIASGGVVNADNLVSFTRSALTLSPGVTFNAPAFTTINNSRLAVTGGRSFQVNASSYSSTGLSDSYTLFSATDNGSSLDLSSITSLDAYVSSIYARTHKVSATNNGAIDLSGLQTVRGRAGDDILEFEITTGGQMDLSNLQSITDGNTKFTIRGGTYSLPSLETAVGTHFDVASTLNIRKLTSLDRGLFTIAPGSTINADNLVSFTNSVLTLSPGMTLNAPLFTTINNSRLAVTGGRSFQVNASSYSSTGLSDSYTLFSAMDNGSSLDLSSITSLDAYVSSIYARTHKVSATNNGAIDLSGVQTVRGRAGDDWLEFVANTGGVMDLSGLQSVTDGNTRFSVTAGGRMIFGDLNISNGIDLVLSGNTSVLDVLGNLHLDETSQFSGTAGAKVKIGGNFSFDYTDNDLFDGDAVIFQFNGDEHWMEVGGKDLGANGATDGNFGLAQLIVGDDNVETLVLLTDLINNGNRSSDEALYLWGSGGLDGLDIRGGSTLAIGDINVYALDNGTMVHLNELFAPGEFTIPYGDGYLAIPEPTTLVLLGLGGGMLLLGRKRAGARRR